MPSLSWLSWLTTLPSSIAQYWSLPFNIQNRFARYACKKFVEDLVRPGFIREDELNAQIESDLVQLRDFELNHQALNNLLPSLPFALQHASMKRASLKLPSGSRTVLTTSLTLDSSELHFEILRPSEHSYTKETSLPDLIRLYAATFVQDAMSSRDRSQAFRSTGRDGEVEVEGYLVGIFTKFVECAISEVEMDAMNTSIVLVHPGLCRLRLTVATISTRMKTRQDQRGSEHIVVFTGIKVHLDDLSSSDNGTSVDDGTILSLGKDPVTATLTQDLHARLQLVVSIGIIGCSLYSWQISRLIALIDACLSHCARDSTAFVFPNPVYYLEIDLSLRLLGLVVLFHQPDSLKHPALSAFFETPSFLPRSEHGYVRMHLEAVALQLSLTSAFGVESTKSSCTLEVGNLSVLGSRAVEGNEDVEPTVFPIVITDPYLPSSYSDCHCVPPKDPRERFDLPEFTVMDWTDDALCPLEPDWDPWKTGLCGDYSPTARVENHPAATVQIRASSPDLASSENCDLVRVEVVPLHIFIDLGQLLDDKVISYLAAIPSSVLNTTAPYGKRQRLTDLAFTAPFVRLEIRCPLSGLPTRSGALIIDIQNARMVSQNNVGTSRLSSSDDDETIFGISATRVLIACSSASSDKASTVMSIGPLIQNHRPLSPPPNGDSRVNAGEIQVVLTRNGDDVGRKNDPRLTLSLIFPSVVGRLSGRILDNLQYWLMDASHLIKVHSDPEEGDPFMSAPAFSSSHGVQPPVQSDTQQLLTDIGRCFLLRVSRNPDGYSIVAPSDFETAIKVSVEEAVIRLFLPVTDGDRENAANTVHSVDFLALTLDALIVMKGKMTTTQVELVQLTGENRTSTTTSHEFFSVRPLDGSPKATLKARFPPERGEDS
ncbi:autophagy-related protein 2 [Marasmius tenuissimus]|uniref:Autophagy-related protein 2 n=1 Tax=Marasmius tenuissimus TaxID=585030 RepID=A0ABR3ABL4_9AGAR